ncbi:MAG: EamA family transporter [Bacteroidota bacterium]|nr:EamA family transporter [Bacteroidota bacterium]MDP4233509.1 EamA family transporter [Bacteroidota bacterium]MDP4243386.1 EamA family transporter [Bacteroidota bacterium]MDP4287927.1 EamA family transporter [Bacteroidota bacterium]
MVYFYLVLQQLIGSTTHLVAQDTSLAVAPALVLLLRASGASILFLPILFITEKRWNILHRIERADYGRLFLLGLLNVPLNQFLYLNGVKYTTPANSALLYAMTPAMVLVLTLFARSERPSSAKAIGILLALVGAVLIMFEHGATLRSEHTVGNILIFIAVIAWSLFTMLGRPLVLKYGAVYVTAVNMIVGTLIYLPIGLLVGDVPQIGKISGTSWIDIAYLAAIASVLNYILWYTALAKLETTKVAIFQNLQPIMTTIMAFMLGRVIITARLGIGGLLTLVGVLVVQVGDRFIRWRGTSLARRV